MFDRIKRGLAARGELRGMRDKFAPSPEEQLHYYPGYDFPMLPRDYAALQEARGNAAGERRTALGQIDSAQGQIDAARGQVKPFDANATRRQIIRGWGTVTVTGGKWTKVDPRKYGFTRVNVADEEDDEQWMWQGEDGEDWGGHWLRRGDPDRNPMAWTGGHKLQSFQIPVEKINELQGINGLSTSRRGNNLTINFDPNDMRLQSQVAPSFRTLESQYRTGIDTAIRTAESQWNSQVAAANSQIDTAQNQVDTARGQVTGAEQAETEIVGDRNKTAVDDRNQWAYNATHLKQGV